MIPYVRAVFSPAHPLARRDVPVTRARAYQFAKPPFRGSGRGCPLLRASNGPHPFNRSFQACSFSLQGWGLIDLPLRASNEGLRRPRVARAQKIIRLHPLLCSASRRTARPPPSPAPEHRGRGAAGGAGASGCTLPPSLLARFRRGGRSALPHHSQSFQLAIPSLLSPCV